MGVPSQMICAEADRQKSLCCSITSTIRNRTWLSLRVAQYWTANARECRASDVCELTTSLCRGSKEMKYEVKGDDDPSVKAWDDIVIDAEDE